MTKSTRGTWAPIVALMMTGLALGLFPQAGTAWAATPSFAPHVDYPTGDAPSSVAVGDLDGDGDLAIANTNARTVSVLLRNGDGTFAPQVSYPTGEYLYSVAVGDLDGDGDLDLTTANPAPAGTVSVLLGGT
ncbi:FG-GAP repeat domain-containing protein [Streptomyces sp. NPDC005134]|uniref:FG-GAP repeat domain-containing protein n=1 Tax=Streptomyces sp. NPDC005098 TaxID=3154560 RepID=UPI0033A9F8C7